MLHVEITFWNWGFLKPSAHVRPWCEKNFDDSLSSAIDITSGQSYELKHQLQTKKAPRQWQILDTSQANSCTYPHQHCKQLWSYLMTPKCEVIRRPVPQQKTCASSKWSETLVLNPKPAQNHPISNHFHHEILVNLIWDPDLEIWHWPISAPNCGMPAPGPTPETTTSRCLPARGGSPSHSPKCWSSGGSPRDILQKNHGKIQRHGAFSAEKPLNK